MLGVLALRTEKIGLSDLFTFNIKLMSLPAVLDGHVMGSCVQLDLLLTAIIIANIYTLTWLSTPQSYTCKACLPVSYAVETGQRLGQILRPQGTDKLTLFIFPQL